MAASAKTYLPEAERKHWTKTHGPVRRQVFDTVFGGFIPILFFLIDPFLFKTFAFVAPGMHVEYRMPVYLIHAAATIMLMLFLFMGRRSALISPVIAATLVVGGASLLCTAIMATPLALDRLMRNFGAFSVLIAILVASLYVSAIILVQNAGRCLKLARARLGIPIMDGLAYWMLIVAVAAALLWVNDIQGIVTGLRSGDPETRIHAVLEVQEGRYLMTSDVVLRQYMENDDPVERKNLMRSFRQLTGANVEDTVARMSSSLSGTG